MLQRVNGGLLVIRCFSLGTVYEEDQEGNADEQNDRCFHDIQFEYWKSMFRKRDSFNKQLKGILDFSKVLLPTVVILRSPASGGTTKDLRD